MGGIGIAVGLQMSAELSISVRRKRRQISVFRALGAERRFVGNLFLYYSVVLGVVGFIGGMIIGHISGYFIWSFSTTDVEEYSNPLLKLLLVALKGIPQPEAIGILSATIIFLVTMAIAIASAYGPSLVAAGLDPVEGLRES
jgi:lipoprotein-releasing system permease protein